MSPRPGRVFYVDQNLALKEAEEVKSWTFPLHHVEFTSCPTLYDGLTQTDEDRSSTALFFKAAYIDTNPYADANTTTVLALHGSPGSHLDFKSVVTSLAEKNIRVIALNFPGYGWTSMDHGHEFMHTTKEKASFIADFLRAIHISKVDVVMSHSASALPAAHLCNKTNLFRSLLLVNPTGPRLMKSLSPLWYFKLHGRFCHSPMLRPLLLVILKLVLLTNNFANQDALLMSVALETLGKLEFHLQTMDALDLARKKFPTVVMYNEKDHGVEAEVSQELAKLLGVTLDVTQRRDSVGHIVRPFQDKYGEHHIRCYVLESRGHFIMKQQPAILHKATVDLLDAIYRT